MSDYEVLYILLGAVGTPLVAGIAWLCRNKCKNQKFKINSGCCQYSSEEEIKTTIREEIQIILEEIRKNETVLQPPTD